MCISGSVVLLLLSLLIAFLLAKNEDPHMGKAILNTLSLEEKIGQMFQMDISFYLNKNPGTIADLKIDELKQDLAKYHFTSFFNNVLQPKDWLDFITVIQKINLQLNKVPILFALDSVHGANYVLGATLFPQFIGAAATFNPDLLQKQGWITAKDMRTAGFLWNFSPLLEIGQQPLWSRMYESFGEDPYLVAELGSKIIDGYHGDVDPMFKRSYLAEFHANELNISTSVGTCMKHFIGYANSKNGHDHSNSEMSDLYLREYILPAFAANAQKADTAMASMGSINQQPVTASEKYLKNLLQEIGFLEATDGNEDSKLIVTDYTAVQQLVAPYRVSATIEDAIIKTLNAGSDMIMWGGSDVDFHSLLLKLVQQGKVPESRIDTSVLKILNFKIKLGLIDKPLPDLNNPLLKTIGSRTDRDVALQMAKESITLLKNEQTSLPLKLLTDTNQKKKAILLVGPNADSLSGLNGGWTIHWQGAQDNEFLFGNTIYQSLQQQLQAAGSSHSVIYIKGTDIDKEDPQSLNQILQVLNSSEYEIDNVIFVMGEKPYAEVFGNIFDLTMSTPQLNMMNTVFEAEKNLSKTINNVLVLVQGRPRIVPQYILQQFNSILYGYLPGIEGGDAIASILLGSTNPSGKLPFTLPLNVNYIYPYFFPQSDESERTNTAYKFGHGLSYTTFKYINITAVPASSTDGLPRATIGMNETFIATIFLQNTGTQTGLETVLLFSKDVVASISPQNKRLRRFEKVSLRPNEVKRVQFKLNPQQDLSFIAEDGKSRVVEPGEFELLVGCNSVLKSTITVQ